MLTLRAGGSFRVERYWGGIVAISVSRGRWPILMSS